MGAIYKGAIWYIPISFIAMDITGLVYGALVIRTFLLTNQKAAT